MDNVQFFPLNNYFVIDWGILVSFDKYNLLMI